MKLLLFFCAILIGSISIAQNINSAIMDFQNLESLKNASWSIYAKNLSKDSEIISVNNSTSLIPASTLKAITTGVSLLELGQDYTFTTKIAYTGTIENSILKGDIIVIGGGDPSLGSSDFYDFNLLDKWSDLIKKNGISKIEGNLIILDNHYNGLLTPTNWVYQDLGNYYGASPSSLTYLNNTFLITFSQSAEIGAETKIIDPSGESLGITLINEVKSGPRNSGDQAYVYGCPKCESYSIRGTIPAGSGTFTIKASMPDPPLFFLNLFNESLNKNGVLFEGEKLILDSYENQFQVLDNLKSVPLTEILRETNVNSNNLYAEHLLLEIAHNKNIEDRIEAIENFYSENLNSDGLFISDGSGLSRYNAITTSNHLELFEFLYNSVYFDSYLKTLPLGGKEGTVKNMFKSSDNAKFYVKSGTLSRVKAYTGFIHKSSDEMIAFSFIVNNFNGKSSEMSSEMEKVLLSLSQE